MSQLNWHNKNLSSKTPPQRVLPIVQKIKETYLIWTEYYRIIPKTHRYSLGQKIDNLFAEVTETVLTAVFSSHIEKQPYIKLSIGKIDTLKFFLAILWEAELLDNKKYITLSLKVDEVGKMLGGWYGQLKKQNSPQ